MNAFRQASVSNVVFEKYAIVIALFLAVLFALPVLSHAQTTSSSTSSNNAALRATIQSEITADPRSQNMTPAQISAMVDALTAQAQKQGVTAAQLTYRPVLPAAPANSASAFYACQGFTCSLGSAFGLDGSDPAIPIGLFIAAALFILLFGIMREMGHPHTQFTKTPQK